MEELEGIVQEPGADPARKAECQEEFDELKRRLDSDTRPSAENKPKSKAFSDATTKEADSVRQAINRAIKKIEPVNRDLARHLKKHIDHKNNGHRYAPDSHVDWDLG